MSGTNTTRHVLSGLRPEPLASYLAGLGLIRVLGEQADPSATSAWSSNGLVITTAAGDIAAWLADQYVPTPVLSPWNNGSGFGPRDKEPKKTLQALEEHLSPRLEGLRAAIPVARDLATAAREKGWLTDAAKGGDKGRVVQEFRNRCPDALLPWIDAAVVLTGADAFFPPLLGTGGNDGRLDFSTNFHQRLLDLLDMSEKGQARSLRWARDLLDGTQTQRLADAAVGQFDPAAAGGPASSAFGAAESRVNPWGYVLLVEGAVLFAASAVRRNQHDVGRAAIPFTVYRSPDGFASGAEGEESRGEIWAPVWKKAFTLAEIRQLFGEARASWRGRPARRAVDFYAATRTLGVARGVSEFVRYGLHRRNGLAFAAVPLDQVDVRADRHVGLIASVEDWPARFRGADPPAAIRQAVRLFDKAELEYARDGGAVPLGRMLAALTTLEQAAGRSGRLKGSVPVRQAVSARRFLEVLDTADRAEFRVAAGIASCATAAGPDQARASARTMRQILLPVDPPAPAERARPGGRWRDAPLVPGLGARPLWDVLGDVLVWRCRTAAGEPGQGDFRGVPGFRRGLPVPAADLHAFARGRLDWAEVDFWLRACLALDWRGVRPDWPAGAPVVPVPTLGLLHPLAMGLAAPGAEDDAPRLALRPDWGNRLVAGDVRDVHQDAVARLRQAGWEASPWFPGTGSGTGGARLAAALVPRCRAADSYEVLRMLATPLTDEGDQQADPPSTQDPATPLAAITPGWHPSAARRRTNQLWRLS